MSDRCWHGAWRKACLVCGGIETPLVQPPWNGTAKVTTAATTHTQEIEGAAGSLALITASTASEWIALLKAASTLGFPVRHVVSIIRRSGYPSVAEVAQLLAVAHRHAAAMEREPSYPFRIGVRRPRVVPGQVRDLVKGLELEARGRTVTDRLLELSERLAREGRK